MSFCVSNGKRVKTVKPGKDFPVKQGGKKVAMLTVNSEKPDAIHVRILKQGEIAIMVKGDTKLSTANLTVDKKGFEIHSQITDAVITVTYNKGVVQKPPAQPKKAPEGQVVLKG